MTITLTVMAAVVVVGLIVLGMAVRSINLAAPPRCDRARLCRIPPGRANGIPTPDPTRAPPPRRA
jgi:hypothetical protein